MPAQQPPGLDSGPRSIVLALFLHHNRKRQKKKRKTPDMQASYFFFFLLNGIRKIIGICIVFAPFGPKTRVSAEF